MSEQSTTPDTSPKPEFQPTTSQEQLKQELEAFKLKDLRSQVTASRGLSLEAAAHLVGFTFPHFPHSHDGMPRLTQGGAVFCAVCVR